MEVGGFGATKQVFQGKAVWMGCSVDICIVVLNSTMYQKYMKRQKASLESQNGLG